LKIERLVAVHYAGLFNQQNALHDLSLRKYNTEPTENKTLNVTMSLA